jgi:hypothetical protein
MEKRVCKHLDNCPNPARKLGWCEMHYQRVLANGDAGPVGKLNRRGLPPLECRIEGCADEARYRNGLCDVHYQRNKVHGDPGPPGLLKRRLPKEVRTWTPGQKHRFYKYGLTPDAFDAMLAAQGGRCYVCRTDAPTAKGWSVDHCHESNVVRFIACNPCNAALGLINEDPRIAMRLLEVAIECQQMRLPIAV